MDDILRKQRVKSAFGNIGNSTIYNWVELMLLTPPVKIGLRASGWPQSEIEAISAARIAGKTNSEIRQLVERLIAARATPRP